MCSPVIIHSVRDQLSRRGFLKGVGGALAAAAAIDAEPALAQQKPIRLAKGFRDVHDLTHTFSPRTPVFPAFKPIQIRPKFSIAKDGFFANEITFDEHTGTHMDAPVHFVANGADGRQAAGRPILRAARGDLHRRARRERRRRAADGGRCAGVGEAARPAAGAARSWRCTRAGTRGSATPTGF